MKNIFFSGLFIALISFNANAQSPKHTIGLRTNPIPNPRFGNSLIYQYYLNPANRLSFGLSGGGAFGKQDYSHLWTNLSIYYQHLWHIKGGLSAFAGVGGSVGYDRFRSFQNVTTHKYVRFGPQVGLEYDFSSHNFPFILGVDYRPTLGILDWNTNNVNIQHGLGVSFRYIIK